MSVKADHEFVIRPARPEDNGRLAELCTQLGYPTSPHEMASRLSEVLRRSDNAVFVAEAGGRPIGWVHVHASPGLEVDHMAKIGGLVVDEARRGRGIGKALMAAAEDWARREGCAEMWLRSNAIRKEAHLFYQARGYEILKTSYTFRKRL